MKQIHIIIGAVMLFSSTAQASIVSVSGPNSSLGAAASIIGAPSDVLEDFVTNSGQQGFNEAKQVTLAAPIATDGVFFPPGIIPAGAIVNSHMIFLNSAGSQLITHADVTWKFNGKILGIMSDINGQLEAASTSVLGAPGTNYTVGPGLQVAPYAQRGLEKDPYDGSDGFDLLSLVLGDPNSLTVSMRVTEPGDWIRVVTSAVPVPAAIWLFGTALIGFIGFSRRRMVA